jgi:hypothetical protein
MLRVKLPCGCVCEVDNGSPIVEFIEACEDCAERLRERIRADNADQVESWDEHDEAEEYLN